MTTLQRHLLMRHYDRMSYLVEVLGEIYVDLNRLEADDGLSPTTKNGVRNRLKDDLRYIVKLLSDGGFLN